MRILKIISKAYAISVLDLLYKKGEMYFGEILKDLKIHKSNLSKLLSELEECELIESREVRVNKRFPKKYYKLTDKGIKTIKLCHELEKIEKKNMSSSFITIGNNNIIIGNANHITLKK
jgi:DNA-binding HxlR family transcriptional regulator